MPEKIKFDRDDGVELESQVILRIPEEPAQFLRNMIREGNNSLKEHLSIKLENDVRYGEVRLDNWLMYAKVVDLPTIVESAKTIDNKSFYKTADVCQMILCKFEPDVPTPEEETPNKNKKKDPNKVDKKYLWPHGITPPAKNIRKRRFRKTLKKKFVEAPEIEKEVKRLLRADNEAVNVKWDIINEEDDQKNANQSVSQDKNALNSSTSSVSPDKEKKSKTSKDKNQDSPTDSQHKIPRDIDIFGEDVSSSDDDDNNNINVELDENSRLSADDSRFSVFSSSQGQTSTANDTVVNEFNQRMFNNRSNNNNTNSNNDNTRDTPGTSSQRTNFYDSERNDDDESQQFETTQAQENSNNTHKIADIKRQLEDLQNQRIQKEQEISSIINQALRQRLQDSLDNILSQIIEREMQLQDLQGTQ